MRALAKAREFGADETIDNGSVDALAAVMELTNGLGVDVAIEAVGVPDTFELCTRADPPRRPRRQRGRARTFRNPAPREAMD